MKKLIALILITSTICNCGKHKVGRIEQVLCTEDSTIWFVSKGSSLEYDRKTSGVFPAYCVTFYKNGNLKFQYIKKGKPTDFNEGLPNDYLVGNNWVVLDDSVIEMNNSKYLVRFYSNDSVFLQMNNIYKDTLILISANKK